MVSLLRTYMRPYAWLLVAVVVLQAIEAAGNLYLPNLNADIIDDGVVQSDNDFIWKMGLRMLIVSIVLSVVAVICTYVSSYVAAGTADRIRTAIYRRVQSFSAAEMSRFEVSSLTTRSVNDVQQIQLFVQLALSMLLIALFTSGGAIVMAVREAPRLSPVLIATIAVLLVLTVIVVLRLLPMGREVQERSDRINQVMREQISGVRVTRAFLRTPHERERFEVSNAEVTDVSIRSGRLFAVVLSVATGVTNLASVGVIWFGGKQIADGSLEIGNLTAFILYLLAILIYTVIAVAVLAMVPRAAASADRILQVLNTVPAIGDPPSPQRPQPDSAETGLVELRNVDFGYAGSERPVLHNIDLTFHPGRTTAIIGGTGSGKSTLLRLIPRLLDATGGSVRVNGLEVGAQPVADLRAGIGLVPQTAFLFAGTIAGNLRLGRPEAGDDELWQALEIAQAHDFVSALRDGLDSRVERGGVNFSGGQRQRLAIARALVRRPRLYLFDDCFSALDAATDARLRAALRAGTTDATVVIVAQRASTIMQADQIIVLDNGRVDGIGTHDELLASCLTYQEIVASQLGAGAAA
ncbi:multidrug ABC transporter ATP-binding protein [Kineosporia sp. NBRC 101677]|uniref:ABC transporter ATP-binding protein n=1 Tax=Kineosporia sp. NBRC 101677 TaxID=3032197 RepID=UPI0024A07312|nr:ABC transporter ATP-binding protein [Kineosporia sp. NBRC 101677]GLY16552.1 multidrug ABC transporter ATP-binding protein [Kineosporia sp. NBRC 101677]